jgi:hypothetical protein
MEVIDLTADSPAPRRRRRGSGGAVDLTRESPSPAAARKRRSVGADAPSPPARRQRADAGGACAPCERCGRATPLHELLAHEARCGRNAAAGGAAAGSSEARDAPCPWCGVAFTLAALALHGGGCAALPPRFKSGALPLALAGAHAADAVRLTPAQAAALAHCAARAAPASAAALPALRQRAQRLGFSDADLEERACDAMRVLQLRMLQLRTDALTR